MIALIPARSGSKRIPHKNVKPLGGVPLMCWTISVARKSKLFEKVVVSSDSPEYCRIAAAWDADAVLRPPEISGDRSTDIEWIVHALGALDYQPDSFALLRPTAPFRTVATLERAILAFADSGADSMRALQKVKEHPYKMWVVHNNRALPLFPLHDINVQQVQSMPAVYWQNASLEMAWTRVIKETNTITGYTIAPFMTSYLEGFDINSPKDWAEAEYAVSTGNVEIPK